MSSGADTAADTTDDDDTIAAFAAAGAGALLNLNIDISNNINYVTTTTALSGGERKFGMNSDIFHSNVQHFCFNKRFRGVIIILNTFILFLCL